MGQVLEDHSKAKISFFWLKSRWTNFRDGLSELHKCTEVGSALSNVLPSGMIFKKESIVLGIDTTYVSPLVACFWVNDSEWGHPLVLNVWATFPNLLYLPSEQQTDLVHSHPTPTPRHLISCTPGQLMVLVLETAWTKVSW